MHGSDNHLGEYSIGRALGANYDGRTLSSCDACGDVMWCGVVWCGVVWCGVKSSKVI
jgi:hypothetical protein